jgi:lysophospholipase L1-like esterase
MMEAIGKQAPNIKVHNIILGSNTENIMAYYEGTRRQISAFNPTHIWLHTGHNDLAFHVTKNKNPKDSTQTTRATLKAASTLHSNHPQAIMIISATFPRTHTLKSSLTKLDLQHFNRTTERHGRRLKSEASKIGLVVYLNNFMWKNKSSLKEKPSYFLSDGLHLNPKTKLIVAKRWTDFISTLQPACQTQGPLTLSRLAPGTTACNSPVPEPKQHC